MNDNCLIQIMKGFYSKLKTVIFFLFLDKICAVLVTIILFFVILYFNDTSVDELLKEMKVLNYNNPKTYCNSLHYILEMSLFGPIIEEIIFRLPLKINKKNIFIAISLLIMHFALRYFVLDKPLFFISRAILIIPFIYFGLIRNNTSDVDVFKDKKIFHYCVFFVWSILVFGSMHFFGYNLKEIPFSILVLLTAHTFISGAIFGYVRVKHGLNYSIIVHCLSNFLVALTVLL